MIEFDPNKNERNKKVHGLPLEIGLLVLENSVGQEIDPRHSDETRWRAFGIVHGRLLVCVYTTLGRNYRIISLRKADGREQRRWLEPK